MNALSYCIIIPHECFALVRYIISLLCLSSYNFPPFTSEFQFYTSFSISIWCVPFLKQGVVYLMHLTYTASHILLVIPLSVKVKWQVNDFIKRNLSRMLLYTFDWYGSATVIKIIESGWLEKSIQCIGKQLLEVVLITKSAGTHNHRDVI